MPVEKGSASSYKLTRYEIIYIRFSWAFILIGILNVVWSHFVQPGVAINYACLSFGVSFFILVGVLNFIKYFIVKKGLFERTLIYYGSRTLEILIVVFSMVYLGIGSWAYISIIFPVLVTTFCTGRKMGLMLVGTAFFAHLLMLVSRSAFWLAPLQEFVGYGVVPGILPLFFFYILLVLFARLCAMIYTDNIENEQENKALLEQLEDKYEQLEIAQEEVKTHYEKIKETNIKLEDANKKLTGSIAELFTLQQISQAISSIFDIKELLKYVNDIVIGVLGVSNSTIILYDEKKKRLKVHTTSICNREELVCLSDNINAKILLDALDDGRPIIEQDIDPEKFTFTRGREVKSIICVPLNSKSRKFGLVLIEHKYLPLDKENIRLLDVMGQQVGIAMENAELYQQMQELATVDGLTGIYNRLYFQDRLQKEFKEAGEKGYELSLAIFDIDHFKRFNDTFGHLFGDKVLKSIAGLARGFLRSGDILARYGGEEFIILFPRTGLKEAYEKVEMLRQRIAGTDIKDELVTASVTVSFGVCCYPECASNEHELLRNADAALYEAKAAGRNCVRASRVG